ANFSSSRLFWEATRFTSSSRSCAGAFFLSTQTTEEVSGSTLSRAPQQGHVTSSASGMTELYIVAQLHPRPWRQVGLLALVLCARAAQAGEPGFTAGADVVIVNGLPGDVETERAYQLQLARLLELVSGEGSRPAQLTVLADAPQSVTLPPG